MQTIEARLSADRWSGPPLVVHGCLMRERLSEPYRCEVDAEVRGSDVGVAHLLGSPAQLYLSDSAAEHATSGVVSYVRGSPSSMGHTRVTVVIEPALAALRHRSDSRIFQEQTTPQILEAVLGAGLGGFGRGFEMSLSGEYPVREYTVQYKESDFDFVHRLMEEDGIGYLFDHVGGAETMVLFDTAAAYRSVPSQPLRFFARRDSAPVDHGILPHFDEVAQMRPNAVAGRHFDWTHPTFPVEAMVAGDGAGLPVLERYIHDAPLTFSGYGGTYAAHNAQQQARVYAEREARDKRLGAGSSSNLGIRVGRRFALVDHPNPAVAGDWVLTEVEHRFGERVRDGEVPYENELEALPIDTPWRPDRVRERPRVFGVQTATVVGPAAEEIHCDEHGRVKVQFHWDRLGGMDEHSSCWIRVVQTMGGAGWGFSFIPRVGMEVVVTFVEGNPDAPLVTGVVYNAANPPPYEFPADKTRTTIRTQSSPGGAGFNELRFEDLAGQEEIWLRAERDWDTLVQRDHRRLVKNNETQEVEVDRSRQVGQDERVAIGRDRTHDVANDERISIGKDRTKVVQSNERVTIGADRDKSIGQSERVRIGQDAERSVGCNAREEIGEDLTQTIGNNAERRVGGASFQSVGGDKTTNVIGGAAFTVGGAATAIIGSKFAQTIGDSFEQIVKKSFKGVVKGSKTEAVGGHAEFASSSRSATIATNDATVVTNKSSLSATKVEMKATKTLDLTSDLKLSLTAVDSIELSVGSARMTMKKSGEVEILGLGIKLSSGPGEVEIGPGGIVSINGPMVKINS